MLNFIEMSLHNFAGHIVTTFKKNIQIQLSDTEKIYKNPFREQRVVVGEDTHGASSGENL